MRRLHGMAPAGHGAATPTTTLEPWTIRAMRGFPTRPAWIVDETTACWQWQGSLFCKGYGYTTRRGRDERAHRVTYELVNGPIPDGLVIDHLCRNRGCVNPAHMEVVTSRENTLRGDTLAAKQAARTTCPRGHEYDYFHGGRRYCRTCMAANEKRRRLSK